MFRLIIVMLGVLAPLCANGECGPDNAQIKLGLSPEALAVRNALLWQLCADGKGAVVDVTDKTLTGRFTPPRHMTFGDPFMNPHGFVGHLLMMFVVDVDGSLKQSTVLVSSGNKQLDEEVLKAWPKQRYKEPGMLDQHPVRVMMYFNFKTKVNGVSG
jgi:TonB family protein